MMAPVVRRTWSLRGRTPVLRQRGRFHGKVTVLGAICAKPGPRRRHAQPRLYFRMLKEKNANAQSCVSFLRQLAGNIRGPIFVVWDRLGAHKSRAVMRFVARNPRIQLFNFPSYAPELNPIEYAWGYLKTNPLANHAPTELPQLFMAAKNGVCRTRRKRDLLTSFIEHSGLPFFD